MPLGSLNAWTWETNVKTQYIPHGGPYCTTSGGEAKRYMIFTVYHVLITAQAWKMSGHGDTSTRCFLVSNNHFKLETKLCRLDRMLIIIPWLVLWSHDSDSGAATSDIAVFTSNDRSVLNSYFFDQNNPEILWIQLFHIKTIIFTNHKCLILRPWTLIKTSGLVVQLALVARVSAKPTAENEKNGQSIGKV